MGSYDGGSENANGSWWDKTEGVEKDPFVLYHDRIIPGLDILGLQSLWEGSVLSMQLHLACPMSPGAGSLRFCHLSLSSSGSLQ